MKQLLVLVGVLLLAIRPSGAALEYRMTLRGGPADVADGSYRRGERILRAELVEIKRSKSDDRHQQDAVCALGAMLTWRNPSAEASRLLRRCIRLRKSIFGARSLEVAAATNALALNLGNEGDVQAALKWGHRALDARSAILGTTDPLVAVAIQDLGLILHQAGRLREADERYQRALAIYESGAIRASVDTAQFFSNLGQLRLAQGRLHEAEESTRRALEMIRAVAGRHHPLLATVQANLATIIARQGGDYAEAYRLVRRALHIRRRVFGVESTMGGLETLADLAKRMGNCPIERHMLRRLLKIQRIAGDDIRAWRAITMMQLADSSRRCGMLKDAADEYAAALPAVRAHGGRSNLATLVRSYADVLRALGREGDARDIEREIIEEPQV